MARFGFVGPSYSSESIQVDCQVSRNFYVESVESLEGKGALAQYPTPGSAIFSTLATPTRGGIEPQRPPILRGSRRALRSPREWYREPSGCHRE